MVLGLLGAAVLLLTDDPSGCVDRASIEAAIADAPVELGIVVDASDTTSRRITLVVSREGAPKLVRTLEIASGDCDGVPRLVARIVDRYLQPLSLAIPEEPEPEPELPIVALDEDPPLPSRRNRFEGVSFSATRSTGGFDGAGSARLSLSDATTFGVVVRAATPRAFAGGRVRESVALASLGWRASWRLFDARFEARGGVLRIEGYGYENSRSDHLPWTEGAVTVSRTVRGAVVGIEAAASPDRHEVVLAGGRDSLGVAPWRVGLVVGMKFGAAPEGRSTGRQ